MQNQVLERQYMLSMESTPLMPTLDTECWAGISAPGETKTICFEALPRFDARFRNHSPTPYTLSGQKYALRSPPFQLASPSLL